jgi:hypothetical protein
MERRAEHFATVTAPVWQRLGVLDKRVPKARR